MFPANQFSADVVGELQEPGDARVILATALNAKAISALVDGLSRNGKLWCRRRRPSR
jgi:hypothetical protein